MKKLAPKTARQIRGSAAIRVAYQKKLIAMVDDVHASVLYWIRARYRQNESRITGDASPSMSLRREIEALIRRWGRKLRDVPDTMAGWFAKQTNGYTSRAVTAALKDAGFTVKLKNTRRVNDIVQANIASNVQLIKSIPSTYLSKVETIVNQGVVAGRDLGSIVEGIEALHSVTRDRAKMIARDQVNKATQAMTKARYEDLGITKAIWQHNAGGKTFRESHVKMDGKVFDLEKGMYDPSVEDFIQPGFLIACRCSYRPYLPEFGSVGKDEEGAKTA